MLEKNKCPKLNMTSFYLSNVVEKRKNCMQWCTQVFNFWSKARRSEKASAKTTLRTKCSQSQWQFVVLHELRVIWKTKCILSGQTKLESKPEGQRKKRYTFMLDSSLRSVQEEMTVLKSWIPKKCRQQNLNSYCKNKESTHVYIESSSGNV